MSSRKSFGPSIEPWRNPALTGYCCEDFPSRTTQKPCITEKRTNQDKYLTWNSMRLKLVKKTCMLNPAKTRGYTKRYSSSSPKSIKSTSNSIRCNCQKICSWSKRPKTVLEIKRAHFSRWKTIPLFASFWDFTNHRKKTNRAVVFSCRPFPNILKYRYN